LVENAVRVTPAGGTIRLSGGATPGWVSIDVSDPGPGIAAEQVPHVFERSYLRNVGEAPAPAGLSAGSGLGLAIVRELVHGPGGPRAAVPDGTDRAGSNHGRARRHPRESARRVSNVPADAADPREAAREGAEDAGPHLLQVRRQFPRRVAQAQHRDRAGLLQQ